MRPTLFFLEQTTQTRRLVSEQILADTWIAVENISRHRLAKKLGLVVSRNFDWDNGLMLKMDNYLIPPSIDGWTIMIGKYFSNTGELIETCHDLAEEHGEVYYYSGNEFSKFSDWVNSDGRLTKIWSSDSGTTKLQLNSLPFDITKYDREFSFENVLLCKRRNKNNQLGLW